MAILITLQGPDVGRKFPLTGDCTVLGRQYDATICLTGKAISRQHAQILLRDSQFLLEDLDSSNGTFLNGIRLKPRAPVPISDHDSLQIGSYVFALRQTPDTPASVEPTMVVREKVSASSFRQALAQDPALKLQVVVEIAQNLGRTLELDPVLDKLLEQLLRLFPLADRALVILYEGDKLVVRAQKCRGMMDETAIPFSRTIVRRALDEGAGLLSDDVQTDQRFQSSDTLSGLDLHSLLCVPLITPEGRKLGVVQIDCFRRGLGFRSEDLHLLAAICLQVTVVLENVEMHAQSLREERLHQELALAREIQQSYLPQGLEGILATDFEIFGRVFPARQVAGDLYDYFPTRDGRLAFFIGDVSGKGMPAALFMVAVRTLLRHLGKEPGSPAQMLTKLNAALADDNPACLFVTLAHGLYEPRTGEVTLASAGHPPPLLRRAGGRVEAVNLKSGRLLGYTEGELAFPELRLKLDPGDLLVFVTDGILEARGPVDKSLYGRERLFDLAADFDGKRKLSEFAEKAKIAVELYAGTKELQDDVTLLMLRRT
ncbi:MAG: SpoIIE family protein phosphatase [Planctomycetes bacterium]|nr:SpoIIE family protein phosphatase [Planctomycetota bacterium]